MAGSGVILFYNETCAFEFEEVILLMDDANETQLVWRSTATFWILVGIILILVLYAFNITILDMEQRWSGSKEYGYGYLIPVITLFLIWQRKNQLAEIEFNPSFSGLLLILFGGLLFFLGAVATTHTLSQYGLVMTILGIALALLGWRAFKIVMVPLALLFFMVPLPPFIFNTLSTKLQLISSQLGVEVIRWFGISVYLEGNVIDLGTYKLQVVEACSGLRYLFPLATLSFLAAYLYRERFWKRAVVFLSSIPITVLMNSFRIGVIGVLVEYGGPGQAEGFLHYFEGWVVFMACIAILVLIMAVLSRIGPEKQSLAQAFSIEFPEPIPADVPGGPEDQAAILGGSGAAGGDCGIQSLRSGSRECDPGAAGIRRVPAENCRLGRYYGYAGREHPGIAQDRRLHHLGLCQ